MNQTKYQITAIILTIFVTTKGYAICHFNKVEKLGERLVRTFQSSNPAQDFKLMGEDLAGVYKRFEIIKKGDTQGTTTCPGMTKNVVISPATPMDGKICLQTDGKLFSARLKMQKIDSGSCHSRYRLSQIINWNSDPWVRNNICQLTATICLKIKSNSNKHEIIFSNNLYKGRGGGFFGSIMRGLGFGTIKEKIMLEIRPMTDAFMEGAKNL